MNEKSHDEMELEDYFSTLQMSKIEVPEKLEAYMLQAIDRAAVKRRRRKIAAACLILLLLSLPGIMLTPKLSVYAQNIPVLKLAVKWLYGDVGLREAAQNGYFVQEPLEIEKDGIKLQIKDFSLDEERLSFTAIASGTRIDEERKQNIYPFIKIDFPELKGYSKENQTRLMTGEGYKGKSTFAVTQQLIFDEGKVKQYIKDKKPNKIVAEAKIQLVKPYRPEAGEKPPKPEIISFGKLYIPFNSNSLLESKRISVAGNLSTKYLKASLNKLVVSPTRMRMLMELSMTEGMEFEGLYNPGLIDSEGNMYKYDRGDYYRGWDLQNMYYILGGNKLEDNTWELPFIPSPYFRELPKEMNLLYDGYFISESKGKEFTLPMKGKYPFIHKYMGKDIAVKEASYKDGVLKLKVLLPRDFYSVEIVDQDSKFDQKYNNRTLLDDIGDGQLIEYEIDTEQRNKYRLKLVHPLYLIKDEGKIKVEINK